MCATAARKARTGARCTGGTDAVCVNLPGAGLPGPDAAGRRRPSNTPGRVNRLVLVAPDGFASLGFEHGRAPDVGVSVQLIR